MNIHKCQKLKTALLKDSELPPEINCNGADADEIEIVDGVAYLIVNLWEYAFPINFCPFCGEELT